jgi:hypothetical protein
MYSVNGKKPAKSKQPVEQDTRKEKNGTKFNIKFGKLKTKARELISPREKNEVPPIIISASEISNYTKKSAEDALLERVASHKSDEPTALARFHNCKTVAELKFSCNNAANTIKSSLITANILLELNGLYKDYDIAKDAINYKLRDNCSHHKMDLDEALEVFGFSLDLDQLNNKYEEKIALVSSSDTTSKAYYEMAYKMAGAAINARAKSPSTPSAEAITSRFDKTRKSALSIMGIKEQDLHGKSEDQNHTYISLCFRTLARELHPDRHKDVQAFEFDEKDLLARFNQMTPTNAMQDLGNARDLLQGNAL